MRVLAGIADNEHLFQSPHGMRASELSICSTHPNRPMLDEGMHGDMLEMRCKFNDAYWEHVIVAVGLYSAK